MSEPLTARKRRILEVLRTEQEDLARYLSPEDINRKAFNQQTRTGAVKAELRDLEWRGLVKPDELTKQTWRISRKGEKALG